MSDYVSEDLIIEIFTRLPPKSLLRFRSLFKSWCSRIRSPSFIRKYILQSPKKILFVHAHREGLVGIKYFYSIHSKEQLPLCPRNGYIGIPPVGFPIERFDPIDRSCNGIIFLYDYDGKGKSTMEPFD